METLQVIGTIAGFSAFIAALVQNLKTHTPLKGRALFVASILLGTLLGCLFAAGGLMDFRALNDFPNLLSGGILGGLSGFGASGGTDWAKNLSVTGAEARARFDAEYRTQATPPPAPPVVEEWGEEVDLATYSRADWPAVQGLDDAPLDVGPGPR